jgi:alpha-galactosidase
MSRPKVAVIGAGSFFFGRAVIWNMTHSKVLRGGTLALVDTDPAVLKTMMKLARRVIAATGAPTRLIGSTDRREVLRGADFVVLTFSDRNTHFRGIDAEVAARYGVKMCSADTIGPGGIMRSLREVPMALSVARDVAKLAPDAWVINFVNPTAVLGIALMRHAPVRSFAICDGLHEPHFRLSVLKEAGILPAGAAAVPPEKEKVLDLSVAGVNHFTWMIRFRYAGRDMLPLWKRKLEARAAAETEVIDAKSRFNRRYSLELMKVFGACPVCISHTKEYVPFFQGIGTLPDEPATLTIFDAAARARQMEARWKETAAFADGKIPVRRFLREGRGDHATDIIESMWGRLGKPFYINAANLGAVTNLADDAFLELRSDVDLSGVRPQPVGAFPRGLLGMEQLVLDTHELTAEAVVTCDRDTLLRAFLTDPIVNSISDARRMMEELLERERDALPSKWFARNRR